MSRARLANAIAYLKTFYPRMTVTTPMTEGYIAELSDLPPDAVDYATREIVRTDEFFPSVARLRLVAAEHLLALPAESEALVQVEARLVWGREGAEGDAPPIHPTVKEALDLMGGTAAFRAADEVTIIRGQFLRLYRELRAGALRDSRVGDVAGLLALPGGPKRDELSR